MLSNVLLLIFLGLLIYHLTNPSNKDTFDNTTSPVSRTPQVSQTPQTSQTLQTPQTQETLKTNSSASLPANAQVPKLFSDPSRSPLNTKGNTHNLNTDFSNPLINYSGNIDGDNVPGADLNAAFQPPSGYLSTPDVIDFNKNNVDKYNVKDYLPKDVNKDWFDTDFSHAQNIDDENLINPDRFIIGVNTVSSSLKSPSWDIRGTIPNPKYAISPFNNSSYEPDNNLKSLC